MHLDELHGRRVVLLGLGADVRAAVPAIVAAGPAELVVVDSSATVGDRVPHAVVHTAAAAGESVPGEPGLEVIDLADAAARAEVFVRSPGFPRYLPELVAARERGARMTTPLDLWLGSRAAGRRVVAITGTKGKSTTTELVGHFAAAVGLRVGVAGNLGIPVFAEGWDDDAPIVVLEVSSYQAADLHHVPEIAVLTSLTEDHLDWHGGVDRYRADKLRVLANESGVAPTIIVSARSPEAVAATASYDGVVVVDPPASGPALPAQRVHNAALAAEVVRRLGGGELSDEDVLAGAARSMPGRLDVCPGPAPTSAATALRFVDDALASNPSATAAGLTWARQQELPTVLLLGGAERGVAAGPLAAEVARWAPGALRVVVLPDNGPALAERCGLVPVAVAADVVDAVAHAATALGGVGPGIVLFSPAAPTPSGSGNWQDRSAAFRRAVTELA